MVNGGVRQIALDLIDEPLVTLADIKRLVSNELPKDRKLAEPNFDSISPLPDLLQQVKEATSCGEIFDAIGVPSAENALDILC